MSIFSHNKKYTVKIKTYGSLLDEFGETPDDPQDKEHGKDIDCYQLYTLIMENQLPQSRMIEVQYNDIFTKSEADKFARHTVDSLVAWHALDNIRLSKEELEEIYNDEYDEKVQNALFIWNTNGICNIISLDMIEYIIN